MEKGLKDIIEKNTNLIGVLRKEIYANVPTNGLEELTLKEYEEEIKSLQKITDNLKNLKKKFDSFK